MSTDLMVSFATQLFLNFYDRKFVFYMLEQGPAKYSLPLATIKKYKVLLKHSLAQGHVIATVSGPSLKKSPMGAIKCQENGVPGMFPVLSTSRI